MANTTIFDLLPWLFLSLSIFVFAAFFYVRKWKRKYLILIHFIPFVSFNALLTYLYLQNDPWGQIIWMFLFFALNAVSLLLHFIIAGFGKHQLNV
jgi:hypothetical protein